MGVISDDKREITIIYNTNDSRDKQTFGYLSASEKSLSPIDISNQKLTGTQWAEVSTRLNKSLNALINSEKIEGNIESFSDDDCIKILRENPDVLDGAIVFTTDKAEQIKNPSKVLEFLDPDSAAIDKT